MAHDDLTKNLVHPLATDLLMAPNLPRRVGRPSKQQWTPIFYPKKFVLEHPDITTDGFKLTDRQLTRIGEDATKVRKRIKEEVEEFAEE